jgi:hypothetical protein
MRQRTGIDTVHRQETIVNLELIPADTSPEAAQVQLEVFRRMHPNRRLELALRMSETLRDVVASGVRSRHPNYPDEKVRPAVLRLALGDELFARVYPGVDVQV